MIRSATMLSHGCRIDRKISMREYCKGVALPNPSPWAFAAAVLLGSLSACECGRETPRSRASAPYLGIDASAPVHSASSPPASHNSADAVDSSPLATPSNSGMVSIDSGRLLRCMADYDSPTANCERSPTPTPAFWIDPIEVTVAQYAACVRAGGCNTEGLSREGGCNWPGAPSPWGNGGRANHPINCVTFEQATDYCGFRGTRLPKALEWEYAARGPNALEFPWGSNRIEWRQALERAGCVRQRTGTCEVRSRQVPAAPFGIADMAGNVSEWVDDHPCGTIPPLCDAMLPDVRRQPWRLVCGTSWLDPGLDRLEELYLAGCRRKAKSSAQKSIGFRCARGQ